MMNRRDVVAGLAAAGALSSTSLLAASKTSNALPTGTCDCHVHVLDPDRFPYETNRKYTPGSATVERLLAMHNQLGVQHVVLVQNSVYGGNHDCLRDGLKQLGSERARGVMTIGPKTSDAEIAELDAAGVRGTRLNLEVGKDRDASKAVAAVNEAAHRIPETWNVDINAALLVIVAMKDTLLELPRPIVLDHFGHANAAAGTSHQGFSDLVDLLRSGLVFVKLSGPYQISKEADYSDIAPIAKALIAAAPAQIVWGSDWPHTGGSNRPADQPKEFIEPFRPEDDERNVKLLTTWVSDPALLRRILVETPARLYGFKSV